jgi:hypothetical protein
MSEYRPLSKQGVPDADLDALHEVVRPWMHNAIMKWARHHWWSFNLMGRSQSDERFLDEVEMTLRLTNLFDRSGPESAARDMDQRMVSDPVFAMDVVGYIVSRLHLGPTSPEIAVEQLDHILYSSGSVWEVNWVAEDDTSEDGGDAHYFLARRDLAAARDAITEIRDAAARPGRFLTAAWTRIATQDPDPNGAYDNAIKAVEAAAQPVVSPKNQRATLGTMLKDMKQKPTKWAFALGSDVAVVISMGETLWTNHFRHGTQAREDHTLEEADAAVHLAIPLVRYFTGGILTLED